MLLMPDPDTAVIDPFRQHKTLNLNCFVRDPVTGESLHRATPATSPRRPRPTWPRPGSPTPPTSAPRRSSSSSTTCASTRTRTTGFYHVDSVEGIWNTGRDEGPNLGFKPRHKEGYFPVPPIDHFQDLRSEMILAMERLRDRHRGPAPRGRHRRAGRDRHALRPACRDGRQAAPLQVHRQERLRRSTATRRPSCPSRSSATTARGMHIHQSLWKGGEPLFYDEPATPGSQRHGPLVHRRPAQARPGDPRLCGAHHQLLQAPGAGLRGAGQPRLLPAQPFCLRPHPHLLASPRPSASSSVAPTRPATRTWPSPPC